MESLLGELKRYVSFGEEDERALHALHPFVAPEFPRIAQAFYDRILTHEQARLALEGGESQVGRLKVSLQAWMVRLFEGPWDEEYFELRCRIGRVHVRIALPQHYMFGAMNVLRREFDALVDARLGSRPDELRRARAALGKILDLELAIMLHTYRQDLLAQQQRVERLSTFGQLAGTIGHELRNPLGVIESSVYILKGRVGDDERSLKHLERIAGQVALSNQIITTLLDLIRDRPLARGPVLLAEVVEQARAAVALPEGVSLHVSGFEALPELQADATQLRQAFVNLLENAAHAVGLQGEVWVCASQRGRLLEVTVEDTGPGVDPAVRRRLFEPLVTSKPHGSGLGLAFVRRILERHEGSVTYEPAPGQGARFVLRLPLRADAHA